VNLDLHLPIDLQESALSNYRNRHDIDNISRVTQDAGKMVFVLMSGMRFSMVGKHRHRRLNFTIINHNGLES